MDVRLTTIGVILLAFLTAGVLGGGVRVLGPIEILGVQSIDYGLVTLRVRLKTLPLQQGPVANELRRRILAAFLHQGIKPYA